MWASRCRRAVLLVDGKETLKEAWMAQSSVDLTKAHAKSTLSSNKKLQVVPRQAGSGSFQKNKPIGNGHVAG